MKLANLIIFLFLFVSGVAIAGTSSDKHTGHTMNPEMKRQHKTMATIGKQWKACRNALNDNNFKDAGIAVEIIIKAAADIDNFKLHKNTDNHKQFMEQCSDFREKIIKLQEVIKAKDADDVDNTVDAIEESCKQCHTKFR